MDSEWFFGGNCIDDEDDAIANSIFCIENASPAGWPQCDQMLELKVAQYL